jgi:hypothetical protein
MVYITVLKINMASLFGEVNELNQFNFFGRRRRG